MAVTWRCTALIAMVNTDHSSDTFTSAASWPCLGGHHPRGGDATRHSGSAPQGNSLLLASQPITATGVAVHWTRGGGAPVVAPQAEFRLLFFTFLTTFANVLTLQVFHHHVQVC
jgi:hypothetical protein